MLLLSLQILVGVYDNNISGRTRNRINTASNTGVTTNIESPPGKVHSVMKLEMLLENYLMQIEWVQSEGDDILHEITNTEGEIIVS